MENLSEKEKMFWEEARGWAVCEILAKYRNQLAEAHINHYRRLTSGAGGAPYCKCKIFLPDPSEFIPKCLTCGKPPLP